MFSQKLASATLLTVDGVLVLASMLSVGLVERGVHSNWPSKSWGNKSVKKPRGSLASRGSNVSGALQTGHSISPALWPPGRSCFIAGRSQTAWQLLHFPIGLGFGCVNSGEKPGLVCTVLPARLRSTTPQAVWTALSFT